MVCPRCKGSLRVLDSVHNATENETFRKRRCVSCEYLFYTVEFEVEQNKRFEEEWAANHRACKGEEK